MQPADAVGRVFVVCVWTAGAPTDDVRCPMTRDREEVVTLSREYMRPPRPTCNRFFSRWARGLLALWANVRESTFCNANDPTTHATVQRAPCGKACSLGLAVARRRARWRHWQQRLARGCVEGAREERACAFQPEVAIMYQLLSRISQSTRFLVARAATCTARLHVPPALSPVSGSCTCVAVACCTCLP